MGKSGQPLGKDLGQYSKYVGVAQRNAGLVESRVEDKMAVQEMTRQVMNFLSAKPHCSNSSAEN